MIRAILMLVALACAQLGPLVHALTTEHATCAEHGELIEVAGEIEQPAPPASESPEFTTKAEDPSDEHGHDHCYLAAHVSPAGETTLSIWTGHVQLETRTFSPPVAFVLARPVLTLAPKQSPPVS